MISLLGALGIGIGASLLYTICSVIYNLYFHPLAKFPGPKSAAFSEIWYCREWTSGNWIKTIDSAHEKYGDVVRISPNELSIATPTAMKEIYGHAPKGRSIFLKSAWYSGAPGPVNIASARDPKVHQEYRRAMAHAFSSKALRLQTDVVIEYIDKFIKQIERYGSNAAGIPMEEWFNWLTFDIIGDLAFGESFGAVENAKTSFWVSIILSITGTIGYMDAFNRLPFLKPFAPWLLPELKKNFSDAEKHSEMTAQMIKGRIRRGNTRDDFFSHIISSKHATMEEEALASNAVTLITAGSETTATCLSGGLYYMLKKPHCIARLQTEIRSKFKASSEIDHESTNHLAYLNAVIEEMLRIYPPAPTGLPRVSNGAMVDGNYIPAGTILHSPTWVCARSNKFWHRGGSFHPERWLPKDDIEYDIAFANDQHDAFKPFSQGPRACIGINLAYMELRIILAKLVWHFDWELMSNDLDWERDNKVNILWEKPQIRVRMVPRAVEE